MHVAAFCQWHLPQKLKSGMWSSWVFFVLVCCWPGSIVIVANTQCSLCARHCFESIDTSTQFTFHIYYVSKTIIMPTFQMKKLRQQVSKKTAPGHTEQAAGCSWVVNADRLAPHSALHSLKWECVKSPQALRCLVILKRIMEGENWRKMILLPQERKRGTSLNKGT
jgi:hypothetical protein